MSQAAAIDVGVTLTMLLFVTQVLREGPPLSKWQRFAIACLAIVCVTAIVIIRSLGSVGPF